MYHSKTRAFVEVDSFNARNQWEEKIRNKVENENKEYILGVDEEEYKNFLTEEFKVIPLVVYEESEKIEQPRVTKEEVPAYPRDYVVEKDVYHFTIRYAFSGSAVLFKIKPNTWTWISNDIIVDEYEKTVSFSFKLYERDPKEFKREKSDAFRAAFTNIENVNKFADEWNASVAGIVHREFQKVKNKFLKENDFFAAINITTNKDTESIFSVPAVKKINIPQPKVDRNKEFASIPSMAKTVYADILKVIYDAGKSMEKKPAL